MNLPSNFGEEHLEPRGIVARAVREHAAQLAGEPDAPGGAGGDLLAGDEAVIQRSGACPNLT
jgi:hypothetical protein